MRLSLFHFLFYKNLIRSKSNGLKLRSTLHISCSQSQFKIDFLKQSIQTISKSNFTTNNFYLFLDSSYIIRIILTSTPHSENLFLYAKKVSCISLFCEIVICNRHLGRNCIYHPVRNDHFFPDDDCVRRFHEKKKKILNDRRFIDSYRNIFFLS